MSDVQEAPDEQDAREALWAALTVVHPEDCGRYGESCICDCRLGRALDAYAAAVRGEAEARAADASALIGNVVLNLSQPTPAHMLPGLVETAVRLLERARALLAAPDAPLEDE